MRYLQRRNSFVEKLFIDNPMNDWIEFSLFILNYVVYSNRSFFMSAKNRNYDPMSEDGYDSKIPLYNDEVFQHGIHFNAKVIISDSIGNFWMIILVYWFDGSTKTNKSSGNCCCYASDSRM